MIKPKLLTAFLCLFATSLFGQVIKSAMINGCKTEGLNEYFVLKNGNSSFNANNGTVDIRYGTSFPATTTETDSFLVDGDSNYVSALNQKLLGGCDFQFVNAKNNSTIPANAYFLIMHHSPDDTANFSAWCGNNLGDVYVLFSFDQSWGANGEFANDTRSAPRYFKSIINGTTFNYSYNGFNLGTDGGYVTWNDTAGNHSGFGTYTNCTPTNLVTLPVSLLYFQSVQNQNNIQLLWATASEFNNDYFTIKKFNAFNSNWEVLTHIQGKINEQQITYYNFTDFEPTSKKALYELSQTDIDGTVTHLGYVAAQSSTKGIKIEGQSKGKMYLSTDDLYNPISVTTYRLDGSVMNATTYTDLTNFVELKMNFDKEQLVIVKIEQSGKIITKKYLPTKTEF